MKAVYFSALPLVALVVAVGAAKSEEPKKATKVVKSTYAESVAEILNNHCVECHRPKEVAPFSLLGYDNAKKWAPMIANVTQSRRMPVWKAEPGFGEFQHENRLTEDQIATLQAWNKAGAPRGDVHFEPKEPTFSGEWSLGKPDLILTPEREFKLEAEGRDVYRNFVLKTSFKEPIWVKAMDVKPGNRKVVHHVIAYIDGSGRAQELENETKDGQLGYVTFGGPGFLPKGALGGWAPGMQATKTAPGTAFRLNPGETIVMQVHYHKSGKAEIDKTQMGLYIADEPIEKPMHIAWLANPFFRIPAGAKNHPVTMTQTIPSDVTLYGLTPHMHLLGKQMKAEVETPDGKRVPLVWVKDWDFNWQMVYRLKQPLKVAKGSKILISGSYDNSTENPNQPNNPPRAITWGEETTDEMFLLVAYYTVDRKGDRTFGEIGD